jgi:hypothetical protein
MELQANFRLVSYGNTQYLIMVNLYRGMVHDQVQTMLTKYTQFRSSVENLCKIGIYLIEVRVSR